MTRICLTTRLINVKENFETIMQKMARRKTHEFISVTETNTYDVQNHITNVEQLTWININHIVEITPKTK